jgi:hypothetical protein
MLVLLLVMFFILFIAYELININVVGFPPKDKDVLEFVEKLRNSNPYLLDSMLSSRSGPYISTTLSTILMGCYISDVGAIPRWYKSYDEIQKLYAELGSKSSKTKREILGL